MHDQSAEAILEAAQELILRNHLWKEEIQCYISTEDFAIKKSVEIRNRIENCILWYHIRKQPRAPQKMKGKK